MLSVKVIDNIKIKLFPIGHFFVQSIPDQVNTKKRYLTRKYTSYRRLSLIYLTEFDL